MSDPSTRPLALITGATAGIGREFCRQLAELGHDLLVVARDGNRLEGLRRELETRNDIAVDTFPADLTVDDDVSRLVGLIAASHRLELLVNNAGFGSRGTLANASPARQEAMLRLHVMTPMRLTQAVLPLLLQHGRGAIVNVSSVASFLYSAGNVNYCATKAYLTTFSEGLAAELRGTGVQAQALCPGFTRSEFHQRMEVDTSDIPAWLWLSAEKVVRSSLRSLGRGGPVVCIPGLRYKLLVSLVRHLPRGMIGQLSRLRSSRM
ncbi:MAG TPA: SDR family oxidoreductase [Gemmatimonadales bacterium]|nr:SDR family oxidoreductase [Gemmatimonadales bacterium]